MSAQEGYENPMVSNVVLRDVRDDDPPIFFAQQLDPQANVMAAFTAKDPADRTAFDAHWAKIRANKTISIQTILADGQVAGNIVRFSDYGQPEVGYFLGRAFWGQGIATRALAAFLRQITTRPLYAHAAKDNAGSLRVLQKCGFVVTGEGREYSNARGCAVEEYELMLASEAHDADGEKKGS